MCLLYWLSPFYHLFQNRLIYINNEHVQSSRYARIAIQTQKYTMSMWDFIKFRALLPPPTHLRCLLHKWCTMYVHLSTSLIDDCVNISFQLHTVGILMSKQNFCPCIIINGCVHLKALNYRRNPWKIIESILNPCSVYFNRKLIAPCFSVCVCVCKDVNSCCSQTHQISSVHTA